MTARAIGVARKVGILCSRPTGEAARRAGVAGDTVAAGGRHVIGVGRRTQRAVGALPGIRAVMTRIAADCAHCRMVHHVGCEADGRIGVATAALDCTGWNMRRRPHPQRDGAVVTS